MFQNSKHRSGEGKNATVWTARGEKAGRRCRPRAGAVIWALTRRWGYSMGGWSRESAQGPCPGLLLMRGFIEEPGEGKTEGRMGSKERKFPVLFFFFPFFYFFFFFSPVSGLKLGIAGQWIMKSFCGFAKASVKKDTEVCRNQQCHQDQDFSRLEGFCHHCNGAEPFWRATSIAEGSTSALDSLFPAAGTQKDF